MTLRTSLEADIRSAVRMGLRYVSLAQDARGAFPAYSSSDLADFSDAKKTRAVFPTALTLNALTDLWHKEPLYQRTGKRAAAYLLRQRSKNWSFNYWEQRSKDAAAEPYPDDMDDTFVALAALKRWDPKLVDGAALAKIVRLCFLTEEAPGGPYCTWLLPPSAPSAWRDVDLAVNANIASFWRVFEVELPGLKNFLRERLRKKDYGSLYYPKVFPVLYFLSRALSGKEAVASARFLLSLKRRDGSFGTPLDTALALSSLLRFGISAERLRRTATWLLASKTGTFFEAEGCYADPARRGVAHYAGSRALTTAFALEALDLYLEKASTGAVRPEGNKDRKKKQQIIALALKRLKGLPPVLRKKAEAEVERMAVEDKDGSITLLSLRFRDALKSKSKISPVYAERLGAANLIGWAAYDILDDIWDGDISPVALPVASSLVRETSVAFGELLESDAEKDLFAELLAKTDEAARWELKECRGKAGDGKVFFGALPRFDSYVMLADRSLAHAMGPLALFARAGHGPGSFAGRALLSFFRSYLIARQLNDDAHDWEEDLMRGRLTPANVLVLKAARMQKVREADLERLRIIFWKKSIFILVPDIQKEIFRARKWLKALSGVMDTHGLELLLQPLEQSAKRALGEAGEAKKFIKIF